MNQPVLTLPEHADGVADVVRALVTGDGIRGLSDDALTDLTVAAGRLLRAAEAVLIEATIEVDERSVTAEREARFTTRHGCASVNEFFQRATGALPQTVGKWTRAARSVRGMLGLCSGEPLPPMLPGMRAALAAGAVGVDGLLAVVDHLAPVRIRANADDFLAADTAIAEAAIGAALGEPVPAIMPEPADLLKIRAQAWAAALDQDGSEPRDAHAHGSRSFRLGREKDGLIPVRGNLLPEVAAQFRLLDAAINNPRVTDGVRFQFSDDALQHHTDDRDSGQRGHDALATALTAAAGSGALPTVNGAAPVLVVHVTEETLREGEGWCETDGVTTPVQAALHVGCSGVIQRITTDQAGRITNIGTEQRCFSRAQRRAITLRDGGCIIPGCGTPAAWCEIHHVTEWARGGPTHTDNGVLLCWNHHRFIDHNGWNIRTRHGLPEVRPPAWIDPQRHWQPAGNTANRPRVPDRDTLPA